MFFDRLLRFGRQQATSPAISKQPRLVTSARMQRAITGLFCKDAGAMLVTEDMFRLLLPKFKLFEEVPSEFIEVPNEFVEDLSELAEDPSELLEEEVAALVLLLMFLACGVVVG